MLTPLGISDSITPFWQKTGHFFLYPLATPLLLIALAAALFTVLAPSSNIGFVYGLVGIFGIGFLFKVAFSVMEFTAYGNLDKPNWQRMMATDNGWVFLKMLAMLIIVVASVFKIAEFSSILSIVTGVFFALAFPAMNMILVMDKSMWSALNPARILFVMSAIGGSYFILLGLLVLFGLSSSYGAEFFTNQLSPKIGIPLAQFFSTYLMFASYHMYGYVIYQYHFELGFSVERHKLHHNIQQHGQVYSADSDNQAIMRDADITEAEIFIQEGRYQSAEQVLRDALKLDETNNNVYELLYKLFALQGNLETLVKLANKHFAVLAKQRSANYGRIYYQQVREHVAEYVPDKPETIYFLITALNRKDEVKLNLKLLTKLKQQYIDYEKLADACFLVGKQLVETNDRDKGAKVIKWGANLAKGDLKTAMTSYLKML
jgi:tetratricopeptide (TPR) repeat protein